MVDDSTRPPRAGDPARAEDSVRDPEKPDYLFQDLSILPPLEEFRNLYQKKIRAFEAGESRHEQETYRQAYELGVQLIRRRLGEEESC